MLVFGPGVMVTISRFGILVALAMLAGLGAVHADQPGSSDQALASFSAYKNLVLAEIGPYEAERRAYIVETIDELGRVLRRFPDRDIVATLETDTFGDGPILDLIDINGDGIADLYAYSVEGGGGGERR